MTIRFWTRVTGCPSSSTWSPGSTDMPRVATVPFTVTRPSSMSFSEARREATPAAAMNFCNLSPMRFPFYAVR